MHSNGLLRSFDAPLAVDLRGTNDLDDEAMSVMELVIGIGTLVVGTIAWVGQCLAFFTPALAERLGVLERESDMDPILYLIETRAMGAADALLAWTLPCGALLMLLGHPYWPFFGLVGGGVFLYFSVLIVLARVVLRRRGLRAGSPSAVRAAYLFGGLWLVSALAMTTLAIRELVS